LWQINLFAWLTPPPPANPFACNPHCLHFTTNVIQQNSSRAAARPAAPSRGSVVVRASAERVQVRALMCVLRDCAMWAQRFAL
jgi:hypothetical protein